MAYQDIKRAKVAPELTFTMGMTPDVLVNAVARIVQEYQQLAQEVVLCHNSIQEFPVAVGNGLTAIAVVFPAPTKTALYTVSLNPEFDAGSFWTTAKTTTGFTANWKTASVGAQTIRVLVIE
jgi:hypothetical protein